MNTTKYNYSYSSRIGNALTEPFYRLYKADTKYLETFDTNTSIKDISEKVFNSISVLLLNIVAIPISLPLWLIGKIIVQYASPKLNYSVLSNNADPTNSRADIKADLLAMVKNYKEGAITKVFFHSHGAWYSSYDYRVEPNREFGAIPGLESVRNTDSTVEKIHSFLEQKMIFTKLSDSNRLIETIQKTLNAKTSDKMSERSIDSETKNSEEQAFSMIDLNRSILSNLKFLRNFNPDLSFKDLISVIRKAKNRKMFGDNINIEEPVIKDFSVSVKKETDSATKYPQNQRLFNKSDYNNYLVELVSQNHKLPLEEAINFVAKNFYSGNSITHQGVNCLLRGIGVLS